MSDAPFFVGYLKTPRGLTRSNRVIAGLLVAWMAVAGLTLAAFQADPGSGTWGDEQVQIRGVFRCVQGVPIVELSGSGGTEGVLLVRPGKFGFPDAYCGPRVNEPRSPGGLNLPVQDLTGQHVVVSGTVLERHGQRMLEVTGLDVDVAQTTRVEPEKFSRDRFVMRGEIVDSKCYLGAMKPGSGPVHRSCAALCLAGGLPAGLVASDSPSVFVVLSPAEGMADNWSGVVGAQVEVSGEVVRIGRLGVLVAETVTRLP